MGSLRCRWQDLAQQKIAIEALETPYSCLPGLSELSDLAARSFFRTQLEVSLTFHPLDLQKRE